MAHFQWYFDQSFLPHHLKTLSELDPLANFSGSAHAGYVKNFESYTVNRPFFFVFMLEEHQI